MSARNDICSRNKEEAELRSTHASQYKREVVLIAYTPEDQPYLSYIDYFKASKGMLWFQYIVFEHRYHRLVISVIIT